MEPNLTSCKKPQLDGHRPPVNETHNGSNFFNGKYDPQKLPRLQTEFPLRKEKDKQTTGSTVPVSNDDDSQEIIVVLLAPKENARDEDPEDDDSEIKSAVLIQCSPPQSQAAARALREDHTDPYFTPDGWGDNVHTFISTEPRQPPESSHDGPRVMREIESGYEACGGTGEVPRSPTFISTPSSKFSLLASHFT